MTARAPATQEIEKSPAAAPMKEEDGRIATAPIAPAVHLAKAKADEAADNADTAPKKLWAVQVASTVNEDAAEALAEKLKAKGYKTNIVPAEIGGRLRFRVEVGPYKNVDEAQSAQKELATVHKLEQAFILTRATTPAPSAQ